MTHSSTPVGIDTLSREEIIFIFLLLHQAEKDSQVIENEETVSKIWESAHLPQPYFVEKQSSKKETIKSLVTALCEESVTKRTEKKILDIILDRTKTGV